MIPALYPIAIRVWRFHFSIFFCKWPTIFPSLIINVGYDYMEEKPKLLPLRSILWSGVCSFHFSNRNIRTALPPAKTIPCSQSFLENSIDSRPFQMPSICESISSLRLTHLHPYFRRISSNEFFWIVQRLDPNSLNRMIPLKWSWSEVVIPSNNAVFIISWGSWQEAKISVALCQLILMISLMNNCPPASKMKDCLICGKTQWAAIKAETMKWKMKIVFQSVFFWMYNT